MGCGRNCECVLQLATPAGVSCIFRSCWEPTWVTICITGAADVVTAVAELSLVESSSGLWSSEVGGGFSHGQSRVGGDYGFCHSSTHFSWLAWELSCENLWNSGESCNSWVGFVVCLGPEMPLQLCLAHPGIHCFYVKLDVCVWANHNASTLESSNFNIALFPS